MGKSWESMTVSTRDYALHFWRSGIYWRTDIPRPQNARKYEPRHVKIRSYGGSCNFSPNAAACLEFERWRILKLPLGLIGQNL